MKCFRIRVFGKVQGVWFRASTQREADKLGIRGTVENLPDRSVEIIAHGGEEHLNQLVHWCKQGPVHAQVSNLTVEDLTDQQLALPLDFTILR